ncbi:hypothetical protein ACGFS9_24355 [Streptomyces sp. NPDC048566]|uniref:hypothetical protein n=1 Tax=Streptomyces sp. NPDC048566 TaxID=3365569 RepID=UPI00371F3AF2
MPGTRAPFGLAATILAIPAAVSMLAPDLAVILYTAELAVLLLAFATAVWGPDTTSNRAFRLLRWMTGRPEPVGPEADRLTEDASGPGGNQGRPPRV